MGNKIDTKWFIAYKDVIQTVSFSDNSYYQ